MTLFVSRTLSQGRATGFASMAGALCGTLIEVWPDELLALIR